MAERITQIMKDMADAIREKTGSTEKIKGKDMPQAITDIKAGGMYPNGIYYHAFSNNTPTDMEFFGEIASNRYDPYYSTTTIRVNETTKKLPDDFLKNDTTNGRALTDLYLHDDIEELGVNSFNGCKKLVSIHYPDGTTNRLPAKVTKVPERCFFYITSLNPKLELHDNITEIGTRAFAIGTTGRTVCMQNPELPKSLERIENGAFYQQQIPFTKIPAGVKYIGDEAFAYNNSLITVTFEGKPDTIGTSYYRPFYACSSLVTINVPWAEGEVEGAPWGATNATINYNYTGG